MSDTPTPSSADLVILCAARNILRDLGDKHGYKYDHAANRVAFHAEAAEGAIFDYLNNLNTWGGVDLTYEQLYGHPKPEPEPEPAEPQSLRA